MFNLKDVNTNGYQAIYSNDKRPTLQQSEENGT